MPVRDLGRVAYETFLKLPHPLMGTDIPWELISAESRERWRQAAMAAADAHLLEMQAQIALKVAAPVHDACGVGTKNPSC